VGGKRKSGRESGGRSEKGLGEEVGRERVWGRGRMGGENGRVRLRNQGLGGSKGVKIAFWNVAGLGNKDEDFWKGINAWDVVVMMETWVENRGWERIRGRMTKGYKWKVQLASRKSKKGRAIGGMVIGVRNGIEVIEEVEERVTEGIIKRVIKIGEQKWRIIGVYANGDVKEKWEGIREWVEDRGSKIRTIVGGDFNARRGEEGGDGRGRDRKRRGEREEVKG